MGNFWCQFRSGFYRSLGFFAGLLFFGVLSLLFAQSLNDFAAGELISAARINANFSNLKSRLDNPLRIQSGTATSWSDSSGSFVNVTGLSVTKTTNGSPIFVGLTGTLDGATAQLHHYGAASTLAQIRILRDGTPIYTANMRNDGDDSGGVNNVLEIPPSSVWTIDSPGAGTYTYTVQANIQSGSLVHVSGTRLIAVTFNEN